MTQERTHERAEDDRSASPADGAVAASAGPRPRLRRSQSIHVGSIIPTPIAVVRRRCALACVGRASFARSDSAAASTANAWSAARAGGGSGRTGTTTKHNQASTRDTPPASSLTCFGGTAARPAISRRQVRVTETSAMESQDEEAQLGREIRKHDSHQNNVHSQ